MIKVYALRQQTDSLLPYWGVEEATVLHMSSTSDKVQIKIDQYIYSIPTTDIFNDVHEAILEADRRNMNDARLNEAYLALVKILKR